MICASAELLDGGDGVRFAVMQGGREVAAFAVRFRVGEVESVGNVGEFADLILKRLREP